MFAMVAIDYKISSYIWLVWENVIIYFNCSLSFDYVKNYLSYTLMFVANEMLEIRVKK
jgi:hypothetical protein